MRPYHLSEFSFWARSIRQTRGLGSALRFPDGGEWYAFGILRDRQMGQLVIPVALKTAEDYRRAWALVPDRFLLGGQEFRMPGIGLERTENTTALPIQIGFLLRECPPLPEWLRQRELYGLPVMTICVEDIPGASLDGEAHLFFRRETAPPKRRNTLTDWELTNELTELSTLPF